MDGFSEWASAAVVALTVWILISGLDDLIVDWAWLLSRFEREPELPAASGEPRRIAIFVPLWRESGVVRRMVEHNVAAIRYANYAVYLGVYPNDAATRREAEALAVRFPQVRVAVCPHDGPTSKADCLNWIYQRALMDRAGFDVVVTHDAEDIIHPESLELINRATRQYEMVQVPVLPLATPVGDWVHGVYCDEFAEYMVKELPARVRMGGFLPSCGVGTAFTRAALDRLAAAHGNCIFEPRCLTEDYENGFRVWKLGGRQCLISLEARVATREFFPRRFQAAVEQRTRWMMGIALQSWELHGWRDTLSQAYWFWRDRRGLVGNLVSPAANVVFAQACVMGSESWFARAAADQRWMFVAGGVTLTLQLLRLATRMSSTAAVYGWRFAAFVPVRAPLSNLINLAATACAIARYTACRWRGEPLRWVKTEHAYPSRAALESSRRRLGEVLVGAGFVAQADLDAAVATQPAEKPIGEHLIGLGLIGEEDLCLAMALQQGVEVLDAPLEAAAARMLPVEVAREWRVLAVRIAGGSLHVASPEAPSEEALRAIALHIPLDVRFHLVTAAAFAAMEREYHPH